MAVCREVREETGIDTEFRGIINFRHQHNYQFGCSDFYFVCLLRPTTRRISMCRNEIARCAWMDVSMICVLLTILLTHQVFKLA